MSHYREMPPVGLLHIAVQLGAQTDWFETAKLKNQNTTTSWHNRAKFEPDQRICRASQLSVSTA